MGAVEEGFISDKKLAQEWTGKKSNTLQVAAHLQEMADLTRKMGKVGGITKLPSEDRMAFEALKNVTPEQFAAITSASGVSREFVGEQMIKAFQGITSRANATVLETEKIANMFEKYAKSAEDYGKEQLKAAYVNPSTNEHWNDDEAEQIINEMVQRQIQKSFKPTHKVR